MGQKGATTRRGSPCGSPLRCYSPQTIVTQADFNKILEPIVARTVEPCIQCLRDAGLKPQNVDKVRRNNCNTCIAAVRVSIIFSDGLRRSRGWYSFRWSWLAA
jgi:hypothetical protein